MKISRGLSVAGLVVGIVGFTVSVVGLVLSGVSMRRTSPKRKIK